MRETTETESLNCGCKFAQEEETYIIVAAHGSFGRLTVQYAWFNTSRSLLAFLAAWPLVGIWADVLNFPLDLAAVSSQPQPKANDCDLGLQNGVAWI